VDGDERHRYLGGLGRLRQRDEHGRVRGYDSASTFVNTNTGGGWQGWLNLGGGLGTAPTIHYWPMADGRPRWWLVAREVDNSATGSRPAQVIMDEKIGTDAWKGWVGLSPTPQADFWGVSMQFGNKGGAADTIDEVADVVTEIRGSTPEIAQTLKDGIRPGAERDRVNAALVQSDTEATVSVTHMLAPDGSQRLDMWTAGPSDAVFQRSWVSGQGWSQWWNLGAPSVGNASAPDVIHTPDGHDRIFVIGRDKALWMRMYYPVNFPGHGEGWDVWTRIGGQYTGGVQAAWSNNGNWIDVVGRTTTNQLSWRTWAASGGWQPESIRADGTLSGTPSITDWTQSGQAPQADVFTKGIGDWVYSTRNQNLAWTGWGNTSGQATSPVDGSAGDGRIVLVMRGTDNKTAYGSTWLPASGWGAWTNLGGNLSSGPTVHYWPEANGNPRWEIFARDGGILSSGRPGQIVRNERFGSSAPNWGGWTGTSSLPGVSYYGTSVQFGNGNGINTSTEIANAVALIRAADAMTADSLIAGIVPGTEQDTVWQTAFPTSWQYGGTADHSVTTPTEVNNVVAAFDDTSSDAAAATLMTGLSKDNTARVDAVLKARVHDGDYIRDISTGAVYYYAGGTVYYVPVGFAGPAGINLATAKRITSSALSAWTRGPDLAYSTSWRYGLTDHSINMPRSPVGGVGHPSGRHRLQRDRHLQRHRTGRAGFGRPAVPCGDG
jgi:hypothetical protein